MTCRCLRRVIVHRLTAYVTRLVGRQAPHVAQRPSNEPVKPLLATTAAAPRPASPRHATRRASGSVASPSGSVRPANKIAVLYRRRRNCITTPCRWLLVFHHRRTRSRCVSLPIVVRSSYHRSARIHRQPDLLHPSNHHMIVDAVQHACTVDLTLQFSGSHCADDERCTVSSHLEPSVSRSTKCIASTSDVLLSK